MPRRGSRSATSEYVVPLSTTPARSDTQGAARDTMPACGSFPQRTAWWLNEKFGNSTAKGARPPAVRACNGRART